MTEPLRLTDLGEGVPAGELARYASLDAWRRVLYISVLAFREALTALPRDLASALRSDPVGRLRIEPGVQPDADATRIALYVHYAASGRVSKMVRQQLACLSRSGFSIVFVTMSDNIPDDDWQAVRQLAALVVQRPNSGLDFGAWRDLVPEVRRRWRVPHELLLANDSVLGPIYPLAPVIEAMRAGGAGLFGLTESLQGGQHLQSYMLLACGEPAVEDLMRFLQDLRISASKWILIRRGEVRLSRWMKRRGHRVAALFGYKRLVEAAIADPEERKRLQVVYPRFHDLDGFPADVAVKALFQWPVNPTHHLWRVLAKKFNYPFIKTELVRRNPVRLPGVAEWRAAVPDESPTSVTVLETHLGVLEMPADR